MARSVLTTIRICVLLACAAGIVFHTSVSEAGPLRFQSTSVSYNRPSTKQIRPNQFSGRIRPYRSARFSQERNRRSNGTSYRYRPNTFVVPNQRHYYDSIAVQQFHQKKYGYPAAGNRGNFRGMNQRIRRSHARRVKRTNVSSRYGQQRSRRRVRRRHRIRF